MATQFEPRMTSRKIKQRKMENKNAQKMEKLDYIYRRAAYWLFGLGILVSIFFEIQGICMIIIGLNLFFIHIVLKILIENEKAPKNNN